MVFHSYLFWTLEISNPLEVLSMRLEKFRRMQSGKGWELRQRGQR